MMNKRHFNQVATDFSFPEDSKILDILKKHGAPIMKDRSRESSALQDAIDDTADWLKDYYIKYGLGFPATFDNQIVDIKKAIMHVWESRPKRFHTIGGNPKWKEADDDMPIVLGNGIKNRFESFQNWLENKEERIEKYEKRKGRKDGKHQKRGYLGGNPRYSDSGDKREHPEKSRKATGSNDNIDTSHM